MSNGLEVLAELSIALVGFSGLVATLGRSSFPALGVTVRIRGLLYAGAIALIGSTLPTLAIPDLSSAWVLALLATVFFFWTIVKYIVQGSAIGSNLPIAWSASLVGGSALAWLWWTIILRHDQLAGPYLAVVGYHLFLGVLFFVRLVVSLHALAENEGSNKGGGS